MYNLYRVLKIIITAVLTVTSGLGSLLNSVLRWTLMLIVFAIHYSCLFDHMVIWAIVYLIATQLLKGNFLKANCSKPVSTFWALWTPCYIVEYDMYLRLLYSSILWKKYRMGTKFLEFGGVRLVINQSVVPVDLEPSPEDRSWHSAVYYLRLYTL
jgi:hypothetical protein